MKKPRFVSPFQVLKSQAGVAIFLAITSVALIAFIAVELSYDTASEYLISSQEVQRLKSRYAAKAGVEISLLRLHIYQKVQKQFGAQLGDKKAILDLIWSTPFIWPPMLPGEASAVDQSQLKDVIKDSLMEAKYLATIESESSKIDLTDLVSPSKGIAAYTKSTLVRLLENRLQVDDDWSKRNSNLRAEELVNNLIDWMDPDSVSLNSGDESGLYSNIEDGKLPPNQPFKTLDELHMVSGMNDEVFDFLAPLVTIYGVKGLQVNHADKHVLQGLSSRMTEETADEIIKRRSSPDGPFQSEKEFFSFLESRGVNTKEIEDQRIPLVFDSEYNFRITSTGNFGRTSSEIVAIVYDFAKVKERLTAVLTKEKQDASTGQGTAGTTGSSTAGTTGGTADGGTTGGTGGTGGDTAGSTGGDQPNSTTQKGRPAVVYWMEK
jgi:general secretion pathway protein K